jgi:hypothetical protein
VRLGLPLKFLPQARDAARVQVETFRVKSSELRLAPCLNKKKTTLELENKKQRLAR